MKMYDSLLKVITKVLRKWRDICLWAEILYIPELSNVSVSQSVKWIFQYNTIQTKTSPGVFMGPGKLILTGVWEGKRKARAGSNCPQMFWKEPPTSLLLTYRV